MIQKHETKRTKTLIIGNDVFDEYRKYEKEIRIFGIRVFNSSLTHNLDYKQAMLERKQIGLLKQNNNEEAGKKS